MGVLKKIILPVLLLAGLLWLVADRHKYNPEFTWESSIWADPAGYYVYQPALFIYDFDASKLPAHMDQLCGMGFEIDTIHNKIVTKYTYGVALLQSPFFLAVHAIEGGGDSSHAGFSGLYQMVPNLAAAFYCFLGLLFLFKFLCFYFSARISALTACCMFLGTNLYYFTVYGNGSSHVYSFALFAIFLYLTKLITIDKPEQKLMYIICWSLTAALIFLIRPLNILFIIPAAFIDCNSFDSFWLRLKLFLRSTNITVLIVACFIIFFPQMLYWHYLTGKWIYYSYGNESFSNWAAPKIISVLFSPNNGILPYNPIYVLIIVMLVVMAIKKVTNGLSMLITFCLLLYFTSSWYLYTFGCGYSSRNFVEYTAFFAFPLASLFQQLHHRRVLMIITGCFVIVCLLVNQKAIYSYHYCFAGGQWDYNEYLQGLGRGRYSKQITLNDGGVFTPEKEYSESIEIKQNDHTLSSFRRARVTAMVKLYDLNSPAAMVLDINNSNNSTFHWKSVPLKDQINAAGSFQPVTIDYPLPVKFDLDATFNFYIWNMKQDSFAVQDMKIELR